MNALARPRAVRGIRWTPGLVLKVSGSSRTGAPENRQRALYRRLSHSAVAAWKRDLLGPGGTLDRTRRQGGWGALAVEVGRELGGVWTARSLQSVEGLRRSALKSKSAERFRVVICSK